MKRTIEFCGAFNGTCALRAKEKPEEALQRIERAIQAALDSKKSLQVTAGIDYGDYQLHDETA
jgi:hypothetical protein